MVNRIVLAMLCCLLAGAPAWAATLSAHVDRKSLYVGEEVRLTLSLVNSDTRLRAEGLNPNVDLSILTADFDLGVPRASHRFNIYRNRGRSTSEIQVALFPRHAGTLRIPPFQVAGLQSQPIDLKVLPARTEQNPAAFLRSGISRDRAWVGERVIAYLDLYHRVALKGARLGGGLDTEPLRLELTPLPQQERSATIDGMEYKVTRSAWSITPVTAEPVHIKFPDVWLETTGGERIRLPFTEATLQVRPLPADLPAGILVGRPRLTQELPAGPHPAHRPIPWHITLRAPVAMESLPARLPIADTADAKIYFDAPQRDWEEDAQGTLLAVARYSGYIIPLTAGRLTLPAVTLPYFDPRQGSVKEAHLPGSVLEVSPATGDSAQPPPPPPAIATPATNRQGGTAGKPWMYATLAFAILWLGTLLMWWHRARAASPLRRPAAESQPPAEAQLASATSRPALIRTLAAALEAPSLEAGLRAWEERHGKDPALRRLVREVLARHYAPDGAEKDSAELSRAVAAFVRRSRKLKVKKGPATDPWAPDSFTPRIGNGKTED